MDWKNSIQTVDKLQINVILIDIKALMRTSTVQAEVQREGVWCESLTEADGKTSSEWPVNRHGRHRYPSE